MIQGIVFIENGAVAEVIMHDDNDDIFLINIDDVKIGMCPICSEGLKFGCCKDCGINWNMNIHNADIANKLLVETADEQFLEDNVTNDYIHRSEGVE